MNLKAFNVEQTAASLRQGNVIAYPTEAVWGLGCNIFDHEAVQHLLTLKQRDVKKGLILVAASYDQIAPFLADNIPAEKKALLQWPTLTPTTWLVPFNSKCVPNWITGEHPFLAVRISKHPTVIALCKAVGMPIVSTSANPQSRKPAKELFQVRRYFGDEVTICQGRVGGASQPSTIKNLLTGEIIRG